ncbi:hypothetical protein AUC69_11745 [Methyloceanibacter superfactus]|uniref:Uncharacterized protein n=1 Tax=Methyloceanibacter superfactus TaxID=1774969 RepID=A0A1E3VVK4_9HYPH|nr:hypothetical protein AUC69_11745 [Methyloceanibacter superfactus]
MIAEGDDKRHRLAGVGANRHILDSALLLLFFASAGTTATAAARAATPRQIEKFERAFLAT